MAAYLLSEIALPANPTHEIGDGDFKAIGAEFLRSFVVHCGLCPFDEVLDIGCGFGRMALPLAHYLSPGARYVGFDIVREPVDWCRCNVTPRYSHFEFAHVDFHHPLYNPRGAIPSTEGFRYRLPALQDWRPTFVAAVSVFTHLERAAMERFLVDVRAVLAPGGRMFLTAFLTGAATPEPTEGGVFPQNLWTAHGPLTGLIGEPLTAAVGVSRRWLSEMLAANSLSEESVIFGHWRRGHDPETPFQDVIVVR